MGRSAPYERNRLLVGCGCSSVRRDRLRGLCIGTRQRRGCPNLRNHDSARITRLVAQFPDGTMIVRLAWSYVPSEENNKVFGRAQSFVAGAPINIQLMVKDSKKYAATGGWGCAQFTDGKPADEALHKTCFPCHEPGKARDFVFTHYAP